MRRSAFGNDARPAEPLTPQRDLPQPAERLQSERPRTERPQLTETRAYRPGDRPESIAPAYPPHNQRAPQGPPPRPTQQTPARGPRKRRGPRLRTFLLLVLVALVAWPIYLYAYGNGKLAHTSALSGAPDTPGTTFLIVGSDERGEVVNDPTEGHRADTIMLLHKPATGPSALVSLPRDTLVHYPDSEAYGKLNGAFSYGTEYLVQTVEELTRLTIDRYVQISMDGVKNLTDALGGVELCLDYDVEDTYSGLNWTAGCHLADGTTALAFSRMRYSDPLGDLGRTERQRQVVAKIIDKAISPGTLLNPFAQRRLVGSVAEVLTVDDDTSLLGIASAGFALRDTIGPDGLKGAPPIASLNHPGPGGASTVLLADEAEQFWVDLREGTLTPESFASF